MGKLSTLHFDCLHLGSNPQGRGSKVVRPQCDAQGTRREVRSLSWVGPCSPRCGQHSAAGVSQYRGCSTVEMLMRVEQNSIVVFIPRYINKVVTYAPRTVRLDERPLGHVGIS